MFVNLMTKKIEMTQKEAKAAGNRKNAEYAELHEYMNAYPGFEILIKAPAKRKSEYKGLTYEYMCAYIAKKDDKEKSKMATFENLIGKKTDACGEPMDAACYFEVREWFLAVFPEVAEFKKNRKAEIKKMIAQAAA